MKANELRASLINVAHGLTQLGDALDKVAKELHEYAAVLRLDAASPARHEVGVRAQEIGEFPLTVRSYKCLRKTGVYTIGDLVDMSPETFFAIRGFGARSRKEVNDLLVNLDFEPKRISPTL